MMLRNPYTVPVRITFDLFPTFYIKWLAVAEVRRALTMWEYRDED